MWFFTFYFLFIHNLYQTGKDHINVISATYLSKFAYHLFEDLGFFFGEFIKIALKMLFVIFFNVLRKMEAQKPPEDQFLFPIPR